MTWTVMLEVDSEYTPTQLAILVNLLGGVKDCRVADSKKNESPTSPGEA